VIRSDKRTAKLKRELAGADFGIYALAEALKDARGYDAVVMDCAPSIDLLHTAALLAADFLIVPTRLDQLSIKGIRDVLESLSTLQRMGRIHCELAGVLPTFLDRVTNESHEQLVHLAKTFGRQVWPPIPIDNQCRVATRYRQTLWEFAPHTRALMGTSNGTGGYKQALMRLEELIR
jgi:chromosome partitioning protein